MARFAPLQKREPKRRPDPAERSDSAPLRAHPVPANLALQSLYATGGVRAKLVVGGADDPAEAEADRIAHAALGGGAGCTCGPTGPACATCRQAATVRRKAKDSRAPSRHLGNIGLGSGRRLGEADRSFFESRMHADFSSVRVHDDERAARANEQLGARAFTLGTDIAFARGEHRPGTHAGRELMAHELAHTLQGDTSTVRREATCAVSGPPQANADADRVVQAVRDDKVDVVVESLRAKAIPERCGIRAGVLSGTGQKLERWLLGRRNRPESLASIARIGAFGLAVVTPGAASLALGALLPNATHAAGASAEEGLRLLFPALPLLDRLELYDEGYREIEQAQLDVIRAASAEERAAAHSEPGRLDAIYAHMSVKEEYDARLLIAPQERYLAADRLVARAPGIVSDEEDLVFDAIWHLAPGERVRFWVDHTVALYHLLSTEQFQLLGTLARGTEAQALVARLRLATEGRIDDKEAVRAVVDRAVELLNEKKQIEATLKIGSLPAEARTAAQARLAELGELESLVKFGAGALDPSSFLGRLAAAADSPDAFGATARKLAATISDPDEQREFAFRSAKQRILLASGVTGADEDSIRNAILEARAPPVAGDAALTPLEREKKQNEENVKLRQRLIDDREVAGVLARLTGSAQMRVRSFVTADSFEEKKADLTLAFNAARWGEFFQILLQIAQRDDWRARFRATATDPFDIYARVHGSERQIMEAILESRQIPVDQILGYTGDVETLRTVLANLDEERRGRLRTGYLLTRTGREPKDENERAALAAYREFAGQLLKSQTTLGTVDTAGIEVVLDATLGSEPTAKELETGAGRYDAAALMYERQQARLGLERGASAFFTETDETMVAAARAFGAQWLQLRDRTPHELTTLEFAALSALHDRFNTRAQEFTEASNTAGEIAGMIAATVAGIVIVVATGGVTAPAVIAAAAAGAGARVVTREMFGADYYSAAGAEGARDALLGAIDGALAVVGASIGARGAELVGLSGRTLLKTAAQMAGEVAEQAGTRLGKKIASGMVEAAIDGAFSGFVSEAANAFTDTRTWRRGVWEGLLRVGQAALVGGLVGLGGGAVLGAAIPLVGAGLRGAADRLLGQSVERTLAKAGATETLEAARKAVRNGDMNEARRLFSELEPHLSTEEANALWRDFARLAEEAERLSESITLLGEKHTLRLIQTDDGAFFLLCSWCTKVRDILVDAIAKAGKDEARVARLKVMLQTVEQMESNFAKGIGGKGADKSVPTLKQLLGILSESEHLIGPALKELPGSRVGPNFSLLARDPAVAARATELYPGYYEQLWAARREIFRGGEVKDALKKAIDEEAQARALAQAQKESARGAPLELDPAAEARTHVDPNVDIPFGFYDRAGFDDFSRRLNATLATRDPAARLVVEGSSVTGRRFQRLVKPTAPTGAPFALGRLSDYDVAIISDALHQEAVRARILPKQGALEPAELARLGLGDLDTAARAAVLDVTGIAHPVRFVIRPTTAAEAGLRLPLQAH
jgi:uncharacterized protein DUF4157